jgi:hypothetical protein
VIVPQRHPFRVEMRDPFGGNGVSCNTSGHGCKSEGVFLG